MAECSTFIGAVRSPRSFKVGPCSRSRTDPTVRRVMQHYILGSWYRPSEIGRRAALFSASAQVASIFSGSLQGKPLPSTLATMLKRNSLPGQALSTGI